MLRRVAAFCRPLRPLQLVSFPRSRSPVVGVLGLCWMWQDVPFARQRRPGGGGGGWGGIAAPPHFGALCTVAGTAVLGIHSDTQINRLGYAGYTREIFWDTTTIKTDHDRQYTGPSTSLPKKNDTRRPREQEMARIVQEIWEGRSFSTNLKNENETKISPRNGPLPKYPPPPPPRPLKYSGMISGG